MPPMEMIVNQIGNVYELSREQWRGNKAMISKSPELLEAVKKYTWTYSEGKHPYLRNSVIEMSLHEFVLSFIYGHSHVKNMIASGHIIEHLDNNGLNCTYENLHIISSDWNKAKAFSIDKINKENKNTIIMPAYTTDVYYSHTDKLFQMQVVMNDDMYFNKETKRAAEMFICKYDKFDDLYLDWLYLLNNLKERKFDITKFHTDKIGAKDRTYLIVAPEELNNPMIIRNGLCYLNLDAKDSKGNSMVSIVHTSLRSNDNENRE